MQIAGYLRTSLIEWPGKISSVIFVPGCNFRCPFCYNRDLVLRSGKLSLIPEKDVLADLKEREKWIDGIVVTGGEPTLQDDLSGFLSQCKQIGFLTRVYTNGGKPEVLSLLLEGELLDAVTMDIKGPLDERYSQAAGVSVSYAQILKSIQLILDSGLESRFVTTVVPQLHQKEDLVDLARDLAKLAQEGGGKKQSFSWTLRQFWPRKTCLDSSFTKIKPFSKIELEEILAAVQKVYPQAELRGV